MTKISLFLKYENIRRLYAISNVRLHLLLLAVGCSVSSMIPYSRFHQLSHFVLAANKNKSWTAVIYDHLISISSIPHRRGPRLCNLQKCTPYRSKPRRAWYVSIGLAPPVKTRQVWCFFPPTSPAHFSLRPCLSESHVFQIHGGPRF